MAKSRELGDALLAKYGSQKSSSISGNGSSGNSQEIGQKLYEKYAGPERTNERRNSVRNWVNQYNQVMKDISDYALSDTYDKDDANISKHSSNVERLLAEFEDIKDYADRSGLPNAQRYYNYLVGARDYIPIIQDRKAAKAGMRAYEDEYTAYLEQQQKKQDIWDSFMPDMSNPAYGIMNLFRPEVGQDGQGITDQWTDEQRYILGTLQNEDPAEARKYARDVNKGQDPFQIDAANEQEEKELLAMDLTAAQRELDQLNRQIQAAKADADRMESQNAEAYWKVADASARQNLEDMDQKIREMEDLVSEKTRLYNRAKLIQDRQRLGAVSGNDDFAAMSAYQEGITDPVYQYVNDVAGARAFMDRAHNPAIKDAYDQMTEEEIANYNYHYATGGREQAQRYLDTIAETLNQRKAGKMYESIKGQTAKELLFGAGVGLNQAAEGFQNLFSSDDYITPSAYQIAGGMVREDLADNGWTLPEWMGGASLGQVGYDLINTAANMAPSMAIGAINPIAGTLTMGASAAGNAYQEALNEGYSKQQARTYSALVGASEAGLEYLMGGISSLGGLIPGGIVKKMLDGVDNAFKRFAIEMGGSMIGEGFEEGLQEVLTPYFQNLVLNTDKDVNWNEVAYSALLGALSGGVMEAPGTAINAATYSLRNRPGTGSSSSASAPSTPALTEKDIKAKVAEDGKSRIISTGENVGVNDFHSIKGGEATILLENGNSAPMDDVNFPSTEEAARFMTIRSLPGIETEAANDLYHAMKDNNAGSDIDTITGVRDAYILGYNNGQLSDATKYGTDAAKLSPALRTAAFNAGRKQMEADADVAPQLSNASMNKIQGNGVKPADGYKKVVFEGKVKLKNNPKAKAEVRFMDYIAEKFSGTTVHVYQSYKGKDGKYYYRDSHGKIVEAPNGRYVNDEIWIDLNSGDKGEGLALNTFAHEMYHHVEKWNKKGAQKLAEFVVKELGMADVKSAVNDQIKKAEAAGYGVEHFMKYGNNGKGMTREQAINAVEQRAMSDFVADSLETMFSRGDAAETITRLKEEDRGLFDKIKKFIDEWVSTLKQWYSDKTISKEGKMVAQLERFEELQKLFIDAVSEAGANYNAALENGEQKSTTQDGDVKYQLRNLDSFSDAEIRTIQGIGRKSINSFTSHDLQAVEKFAKKYLEEMGTKSPFFRAWFGDWRANETTPIAIANKMDNTRGVKKNEDTGWEINVSGQVFNETSKHRSKSNREAVAFLPYINDIVQKAVLLDSYGIDPNKPKSPNSLLMHSLYAVADIGNGPEVLKLYVEEMNNPAGSDTNKRAYELQNIEKAFNASVRVQGKAPSSLTNTQNAIKNVADLVAAVKRYDANYVPVESSKIKNADGTPKVMYHGSPAQFSRFDRKKAKSSGLYGRGFYFTDSDSHAKTYGNTYSVYLNIRNPLQSGNTTVTRQQVRSYLEAVAENEDYSIENYGTYDVDSILNTVMGKDGKADAFKVIQDINTTAIGDMVEAAELFNSINGTTFDGIVVPTETVAFRPEQIKSATDNIGTFDGQNDDIYHSLRNAPENIHDVRRRIASGMDDAANTGNLKKWAGEYREKIAQAETIESNLKIKDQQIQELGISKNPTDKQKFYALRREANQMRDELGKLNKRIQYIESLKAFRDVSARENTSYGKSLLQQMREQQAENIQQQLLENRIVREELTGKDSDITIMEKEFIRIVKKYEQLEEKAGANAANKSKTISKLRTALKEEAASHDKDSKIWEREYNRLLREYEASGQKIERMERSISRRKETAKQQIERKKVEEKAKALMKMLTYPTKDAHVPMELQQPLQKFLDSIDFTSPRQLGGGAATIKDIAYTRALVELRSAIASQRTAVESSDDDGVFTLDVPPDFLEEIDKHIKTINDATNGLDLTTNRVYEMSSDELKDLSYILKVVNKAVREIDRLHMQGEKARTSTLAKDTLQEMNRRPATKSEKGNWFMWNNYTPYQAFRRYGKAAQKIFAGLTDGQAKLARTIDSTLKFTKDTYTAEEVRNWERTRHTIKLDSGKTVTMTPAQIMSFWCLSHRNQAIPHMQGAGIRISTLERVLDGTKVQKEVVQREHYTLTVDDVNRINDMLTNRQKDVARKLQQYMQRVGGRLINEVSMARWDFMAATETDYFPIQTEDSGRDVKNPDQNKTSLFALLNKSFTKAPMKNAKNALVIGSIFDVFANHMSETAEYNAFALPLIDALKWFNYRERIDIGKGHIKDIGVHKAIKDTLGTEATRYFVDLMTDINSSQKAGRHEDFFGKILGRSKAASVGWNIRVAIQQPSAIFRASMVLKPGSLVRGTIKKGTVAEMQKYSGIALWKSMGYYDLNVARSVEDQIKGDTSFADKFSDMGMWLPGKMDEWTWGWIWESTKNQVRAETKLSGEELLRATAKKFDDVVYQTQVADSVLTRSSFMRSKSQMVKEATSFMAEPTLSLNVLMSAFQDYEEGHTSWVKAKRGMMIGFTGYVLSGLANALLSSIVDAGRDDDEWETFLEKYGQALLGEKFWDGNLLNEMNPLNKIIFVKDILSAITGYENQSSYGKAISGLIDLVNAVRDGMTGKTSKTTYGIIYQGLQYLSTVSGIGLSNMTREVVGVWNNTFGKLYPDMRLVRYKPNNGEDLLLAIQKGNEADVERVAGRFDDQKSAESALKTAIGSHYKDGSMTAEEATDLLMTYGDMDEDKIYWKLQEWDHGKAKGNTENYSKFGALHQAIESGEGIEDEIDRYVEHGTDNSDIRSDISRVYKKEYLAAAAEDRDAIRQKVTPAYAHTGMDEDEIEATFKDWDFEAAYGMSYSEYKAGYLDDSVSRLELEDAMKFYGLKNYQISETIRSMDKDKKFRDRFGMSLTEMKDAYDDGDVSRNQLINALVYNGMTQKEASQEVTQRDIRNRLGIDYSELDDAYKYGDISRQTLYDSMIKNGATTHEADEAIRGYDWLKKNVKNYPDLTISDGKKFAVSLGDNAEGYTLEDYGVSIESYIEYKRNLPECQGVDADGDGKTDSGTKRDAIFRMIDSLPISDTAKDGLALMSYSKKSIKKNAPWH